MSTEDSLYLYEVMKIANICIKWLLSTEDSWYLYEVIAVYWR